ncbi:hypothetical protein [Shewanella sp. UCD-KL21]|nr:hypothetical protein [Shewanella sp. UCD-KL21]
MKPKQSYPQANFVAHTTIDAALRCCHKDTTELLKRFVLLMALRNR